MDEKLKVEVTNYPVTLWVIGWMFTCGACVYYGLVAPLTARRYEIAQGAAVVFVAWPFLLGQIVASWH